MFHKINEKFKVNLMTEPESEEQAIPDNNTEYLIYQTLIGSYPLGEITKEEMEHYFNRIWGYIQKAIREAKTFTNWINPFLEYENACKTFLEVILKNNHKFMKEFLPFQKKISRYGSYNSLSQIILKIGMPGVTDIYQGNELWDFSLVDPDNRRPVDFNTRKAFIKEIKEIEMNNSIMKKKLENWFKNYEDGKIKLYLIYKGLNLRKTYDDLFLSKSYYPITSHGNYKDNIISFARSYYNKSVIFIASRFFTEISDEKNGHPYLGNKWNETRIEIPEDIKSETFMDIFTGENISIKKDKTSRFIYLKEVFSILPFSILLSDTTNKQD
jgi:(1->4)-alpha-D-glucan 1-alpha-D-glucosylmutase